MERGHAILTGQLRPSVLILASRYDLTCDFVISRLRSYRVPYLRLNTEDLPSFKFFMDPCGRSIEGESEKFSFLITADELKGILFRRPVFLRESGVSSNSETQFTRAQWATFIRSFMLFDNCRWMNAPAATYTAEHKVIQLFTASQIGFKIPPTLITNSADRLRNVSDGSTVLAVKGLDTVLIRSDELETFGYTSLVQLEEIEVSEVASSPMVVQQALEHKLDLRVTVVDKEVFCASVTEAGAPIIGDWRRKKDRATFSKFDLPLEVSSSCIELTRRLGLSFGAIDLGLQDGEYFFFEINPTGEWAWLTDEPGFPIHDAIARYLICTG